MIIDLGEHLPVCNVSVNFERGFHGWYIYLKLFSSIRFNFRLDRLSYIFSGIYTRRTFGI